MNSVLLLADDNPNHADTVLEHIRALSSGSRHQVYRYNPIGIARSRFLDFDDFDVVVLHYSVILIMDYYLSSRFRSQLKAYRGLKIQFIQDEYRWIDRMRAVMEEVGIDVVFSVAPEQSARALYGQVPRLEIVCCLTGYVPDRLVGYPFSPLAARPLDVGYRGRSIPFWLGALSQEKRTIGENFARLAPGYNLRVDVGWREEDRIYGQDWIDFLASCRATLASESGASISDFDGSIEKAVSDYLQERPDADFEEVKQAVLAEHEENLPIRAISPRIFESAALGTALILFPGEYSGVVQPHRHYIPLEKDFSNLDEVVERLKDLSQLESMVRTTYDDLIASGRYSYRVLSQLFDDTIDRRLAGTAPRHPRPFWRYFLARLERWFVSNDCRVYFEALLRRLHAAWCRGKG